MILPPPLSTLFPYTTLFRSLADDRLHTPGGEVEDPDGARLAVGEVEPLPHKRQAARLRQHRLFTGPVEQALLPAARQDRKSTRLNSSHLGTSYAVFCLKKKK